MWSWFLRRLISSALLVLVLLTVVFFVVRLAPGDPLDQVVAAIDKGRAPSSCDASGDFASTSGGEKRSS